MRDDSLEEVVGSGRGGGVAQRKLAAQRACELKRVAPHVRLWGVRGQGVGGQAEG